MQEMQETWFRPLGGEDPWEEGTATLSSVLAERIPWTEEPGYSPWGSKESDTTAHTTHTHTHTHWPVISESANGPSLLGVLLMCHNLLYSSFSDD